MLRVKAGHSTFHIENHVGLNEPCGVEWLTMIFN